MDQREKLRKAIASREEEIRDYTAIRDQRVVFGDTEAIKAMQGLIDVCERDLRGKRDFLAHLERLAKGESS